jgi:O-antigen ligase
MAFLAPKKDKADRQRVVLAIVLSAMICGIVFFGRDVIADRLGTMSAIRAGEEASFSTRIKAWQGAIKMIAAHPLTGTGIGTFVWGYPPYRPEGLNFKTDLAHNDYLQAAAEMGLAAAFVVIWAIALTVMTAVSKAGLDKVKFYCGIGVLSMALHGLVDFNFNIPANMLLFTVWTALIMSEGRRDAERKR